MDVLGFRLHWDRVSCPEITPYGDIVRIGVFNFTCSCNYMGTTTGFYDYFSKLIWPLFNTSPGIQASPGSGPRVYRDFVGISPRFIGVLSGICGWKRRASL